MREVAVEYQTALLDAPSRGLVPRRLVHFTGKSFLDGSPTSLSVWTGDGELPISVPRAIDGGAVTRTYLGGKDLVTGSLPLVSDLTIQTINISLNVLDPQVTNFARGSDIRNGKVEIHDLILDPRTRNPVATPVLVFYGEIDGSPMERGAVGGDASITIPAASDVISMLSRMNPAKSSYQEQRLRDNDQFGLHTSAVATWQIPWGREK